MNAKIKPSQHDMNLNQNYINDSLNEIKLKPFQSLISGNQNKTHFDASPHKTFFDIQSLGFGAFFGFIGTLVLLIFFFAVRYFFHKVKNQEIVSP